MSMKRWQNLARRGRHDTDDIVALSIHPDIVRLRRLFWLRQQMQVKADFTPFVEKADSLIAASLSTTTTR